MGRQFGVVRIQAQNTVQIQAVIRRLQNGNDAVRGRHDASAALPFVEERKKGKKRMKTRRVRFSPPLLGKMTSTKKKQGPQLASARPRRHKAGNHLFFISSCQEFTEALNPSRSTASLPDLSIGCPEETMVLVGILTSHGPYSPCRFSTLRPRSHRMVRCTKSAMRFGINRFNCPHWPARQSLDPHYGFSNVTLQPLLSRFFGRACKHMPT